MTKKQRALEVIERLKKEYPDAGCTLDYDQAWKLLVSVRLAAQCTDARVNVVVEDLYEKYPTVEALADAPVEDIEEIVRPWTWKKSKARDISACMKMLRDEYGGKVPDDCGAFVKTSGSRKKERKPDYGGCVRKAGNCDRYTLYPPDKPDRSGRWNQRARRRWRWHCGRLSRQKKEVTFATVLFIMEERYVLRERNRIATDAVWQMSAKKGRSIVKDQGITVKIKSL